MVIVMFVGGFIGGMCALWFGPAGIWVSIPLCITFGWHADRIIDFLSEPTQNE